MEKGDFTEAWGKEQQLIIYKPEWTISKAQLEHLNRTDLKLEEKPNYSGKCFLIP